MAKAEIGGMLLETEECQGVPGAAGNWKQGSFPSIPRGQKLGLLCGFVLATVFWRNVSSATAEAEARDHNVCLPTGRRRRVQGELIPLFVRFFIACMVERT